MNLSPSLFFKVRIFFVRSNDLLMILAFILYRQHYQSAVASQHPGLANPEISKIIGEQWRQQPAEVKNEWKILAEVKSSRCDVSHKPVLT